MNNVFQMRQNYLNRRDEITCVDRSKEVRPTKTFNRHAARLKGAKALAKNEINALCWLLNGSKKVNVTSEERAHLLQMLHNKAERPITKEQTKFGIDWLRRITFKLNGEVRQTKDMPFGTHEIAIIKGFSHFKWIDIYNTQQDFGNYNGCKSFTPVWRVYDRQGNYFDYYVLGCGPGSGIEIVIC